MRFLTALYFTLITIASLGAQTSNAGESPYTDQNFDPAVNGAWYSDPFFVGGMILVVGIIVLYIWKKR